MANRLNGSGALNYTGVNAPTPPNLITMTRRPTVTDGVGMPLGTYWLIPQAAAGITPQKEVWILVGNRQNVFIWKHLRGSTQSEPLSVKVTVYDIPGSYTYTPTDGMINVTVECVGGGGGSCAYKDNDAISPLGTYIISGGGGGAYCKKTFTAAEIGASKSFVVGSGGIAGVVGTGVSVGGDGADSSFASLITAGGGQGALGAIDATTLVVAIGGVATGGDVNVDGSYATVENVLTGPFTVAGGSGGNSACSLGLGGKSLPASGGDQTFNQGTGYGSGAGGGAGTGGNLNNRTTTGVNGNDGVVIITEYL